MRWIASLGLISATVGIALLAAITGPSQRRWDNEQTSTAAASEQRNGRPAISLSGAPSLRPIFSPDTPPAVVAAVMTAISGSSQRYFTGVRWAGTHFTSVDLTYSFVPDGVFIPSQFAGDSSGPNEINARMNQIFGGDTLLWKDLFRQIFSEWGAFTGNTYTEVADDGEQWPSAPGSATRGDIRIAMRNIDGFSGILATNNFPNLGGDLCLDSNENWSSLNNNYRFMRNVLAHEHGHALGVFHICPITFTWLMEPFLNLAIDGPQLEDIRAAQSLYGDQFEPNNSISAATDLTTMGIAINIATIIPDLSLHFIADSDVFLIPVPSNGRVTCTATPTGAMFTNAPQLADGTCGSGLPIDSTSQQNIAIDLLASDGSLLATIDANGLGQSETMINQTVPSGGLFAVRIRSSESAGDVQMYDLNILIDNGMGITGDVNFDGCVNVFDLAEIISRWDPTGARGPSLADVDGDGVVGVFDLATTIGSWGTGCP